MELRRLTRREFLILSSSGLVTAGVLLPKVLFAQNATIRQGYQTNIWGMPTYYLLRSGALEKRGLRFEEFEVPSRNLNMQQMVARQVDLGT
jgi:NitT/TauT family transport system substrate-binding protein